MRVQGEPTPEWLDAADDLARRLLQAALPIRFDVARTTTELDAVFRLRYRITVEQGWRRPQDMGTAWSTRGSPRRRCPTPPRPSSRDARAPRSAPTPPAG